MNIFKERDHFIEAEMEMTPEDWKRLEAPVPIGHEEPVESTDDDQADGAK